MNRRICTEMQLRDQCKYFVKETFFFFSPFVDSIDALRHVTRETSFRVLIELKKKKTLQLG